MASAPSNTNVRSEIREFLASRRALLSPSAVGIPDLDRPRRVPGLRREEVAVLAGISAPYYARLERGDLLNASPDVVDAIGRALRLVDSERSYLEDLASWNRRRLEGDDGAASQSSPDPPQVPTRLENILAALTGAAGFVTNDREEVLAANELGHALVAPLFEDGRVANVARWVFLDPQSPHFFAESWSAAASTTSSTLRAAAGRYPGDPRLTTLIEELWSASVPFRRVWETYDVARPAPRRRYLHPVVGWIELDFEKLVLPDHPRLALVTFCAPPGSPSATALAALREMPAAGAPTGGPRGGEA